MWVTGGSAGPLTLTIGLPSPQSTVKAKVPAMSPGDGSSAPTFSVTGTPTVAVDGPVIVAVAGALVTAMSVVRSSDPPSSSAMRPWMVYVAGPSGRNAAGTTAEGDALSTTSKVPSLSKS